MGKAQDQYIVQEILNFAHLSCAAKTSDLSAAGSWGRSRSSEVLPHLLKIPASDGDAGKSLWQPLLCKMQILSWRHVISSKDAELDWDRTGRGRRVEKKTQQNGNIGLFTRLFLVCFSPAPSMAAGMFQFLRLPHLSLISRTSHFALIPAQTHGWTDFNLILWQEGQQPPEKKGDLWLVCVDPSDKTVHLWVSEWTLMRVYVVDVTPVCCCLSAVHRIDSWTLTAPVSKSSPSACENWVTWISSPLKSEIVDSLVNSWRVSSCLSLVSFFSPTQLFFKFFFQWNIYVFTQNLLSLHVFFS